MSSSSSSSDDDSHFQLLQTAKFSIRSPRARIAKRVQQELIRASERRQRRRHAQLGKMPVMRPPMTTLDERGGGSRTVQEAHKYLPQCDGVMQNAVDLYIASQLQRNGIPVMDQRDVRQCGDETVRGLAEKFFQLQQSVQTQYLKASVLSQMRGVTPCSDPFSLFLDLHRQQTKIDRQLKNSRTGSNMDIGSHAINAERAESGEFPDETRLSLLSWEAFEADARNLWKRMRPDQKLPFFVQAYLVTHFPERLDCAV